MSAVLALLPQLTNVNGDAENALVLAQRARWAGVPADVVPVGTAEDLPSARPTAIVLGSSTDGDLAAVRDGLAPLRAALDAWLTDGVPVLAVGTGLELLTREVDLGAGNAIPGLGLIAARAVPLSQRASGDLLVDSRHGRLVGYENHARRLVLEAGTSALGRVAHGVGDGDGADGVEVGSLIGTRLHGPVLAKNPAMADALLTAALGERYTTAAPEFSRIDRYAADARLAIAASVGLTA
ncbi:hypothetical protein CLV46_1690 [Diaminobutyricimonas aerilata]|uniref:Lipid II isoglutaminyl synthase (glutamine-hydrolyzing) subunit GatD n=1 Tax=Diaminobutyricimonas aerilata TaxID=1162967 RepID=A0A2M9CJR6_9MICO|nr:cobyric acid synthase [Diaminobutyricimonas aerilata]PJJ72126.1 hypothetical protein CLV46_1690 [Diaminobutyricimonas aerilata]